jgi:hypothetical protein
VLGPDVSDIDFVAFTSDQDAYAYSGQKCSAQSALFVHVNWTKAGFLDKIKALALRRSVKDNTIVPILTVNNDRYAACFGILNGNPHLAGQAERVPCLGKNLQNLLYFTRPLLPFTGS